MDCFPRISTVDVSTREVVNLYLEQDTVTWYLEVMEDLRHQQYQSPNRNGVEFLFEKVLPLRSLIAV